jgi:hypothetical protein
MKVIVTITREVEVEVDDCVGELDNFYRTHPVVDWKNLSEDFPTLQDRATEAVERATGLRFGSDEDLKKPCGTIAFVCATDGEAIIEW